MSDTGNSPVYLQHGLPRSQALAGLQPSSDTRRLYRSRIDAIVANAKQRIEKLAADATVTAQGDEQRATAAIRVWQGTVTSPAYLAHVAYIGGSVIYAHFRVLEHAVSCFRLGDSLSVWQNWPEALLSGQFPDVENIPTRGGLVRYDANQFRDAVEKIAREALGRITQLSEKTVDEARKREDILYGRADRWRTSMLSLPNELNFDRNPQRVGTHLDDFEHGLAELDLYRSCTWPVKRLLSGHAVPASDNMRNTDVYDRKAREAAAKMSPRHQFPLEHRHQLPAVNAFEFSSFTDPDRTGFEHAHTHVAPVSSAVAPAGHAFGAEAVFSHPQAIATASSGFEPHSQLGPIDTIPAPLSMAAWTWPVAGVATHKQVPPSQHPFTGEMAMPLNQQYSHDAVHTLAPSAWYGSESSAFGAAQPAMDVGNDAYGHSVGPHAPSLAGDALNFVPPTSLRPHGHLMTQPDAAFQPVPRTDHHTFFVPVLHSQQSVSPPAKVSASTPPQPSRSPRLPHSSHLPGLRW
ncbi:hypothetical protein JCM10908_006616 [Rhodotorula pacifica]|uniref:uncharacterized protein n=1 Tax=Rhodotorula pacifica TaxID=1495444 RepID=UPI00317E0485